MRWERILEALTALSVSRDAKSCFFPPTLLTISSMASGLPSGLWWSPRSSIRGIKKFIQHYSDAYVKIKLNWWKPSTPGYGEDSRAASWCPTCYYLSEIGLSYISLTISVTLWTGGFSFSFYRRATEVQSQQTHDLEKNYFRTPICLSPTLSFSLAYCEFPVFSLLLLWFEMSLSSVYLSSIF